MNPRAVRTLAVSTTLAFALLLAAARIQAPSIFDAILPESGERTGEVSTAELRKILAERSAIILDARPHLEYAISHIPGALNVAAKPGVPASMYVSDVAEVGRLVRNDKTARVVLYCNGPHCGKSRRLAEELLAAGYTNVRRYQLGIPVWRALGGITEIETDGLRHVLADDRTAVIIDVRDTLAFRAGTVPTARHIPRSGVLEGKDVGEVRRAKDDGRLPMNDHNTRIIVVGSNAADARYVAEALAREAFHNVAFYSGSVSEALAASRPRKSGQRPVGPIDSVVLVRTFVAGWPCPDCPPQHVVIRRDDEDGTARLAAIGSKADSIGFYSLPPDVMGASFCRVVRSDGLRATLTIYHSDRHWAVSGYRHCAARSSEQAALLALEALVDRLAARAQRP